MFTLHRNEGKKVRPFTKFINIFLNILLILCAASIFVIFFIKLFLPDEYILNGILFILIGVSAIILAILFKTMNVKKYIHKYEK